VSGPKWPGPDPGSVSAARTRLPGGAVRDNCTVEQLLAALTLTAAATRHRLEQDRRLIDLARRRGLSWAQIGQAIGHREPKVYRRWLAAQLGERRPALT